MKEQSILRALKKSIKVKEVFHIIKMRAMGIV